MSSSSSFSSSSSHSHSHSSSSSSPASKPKKPVKPGSKTPPPKGSQPKVCGTGDGGCETNNDASNSPVRYFNGEVILSMTDVAGGLSGFGHTRSYSNQLDALYEGPNGNNWLIPGWPYLIQETGGDNSVLIYVSGQSRLWFERDTGASTYTARYGGDVSYALVEDSGSPTFTLTTNSGGGVSTAVFHDFTPSEHKGFVKESTDAYGSRSRRSAAPRAVNFGL